MLGSLCDLQVFFWLRVLSASKQSPRSATTAVNANGWVTSSFFCSQADSTVRYGGGQRKWLVTSSSFCSQAESTVRYGGGQCKRLATSSSFCSQAESTVRYGGGQRKWLGACLPKQRYLFSI